MCSLVTPQVREKIVAATVLLWLPDRKCMGKSFSDDN